MLERLNIYEVLHHNRFYNTEKPFQINCSFKHLLPNNIPPEHLDILNPTIQNATWNDAVGRMKFSFELLNKNSNGKGKVKCNDFDINYHGIFTIEREPSHLENYISKLDTNFTCVQHSTNIFIYEMPS